MQLDPTIKFLLTGAMKAAAQTFIFGFRDLSLDASLSDEDFNRKADALLAQVSGDTFIDHSVGAFGLTLDQWTGEVEAVCRGILTSL